MANCGVCPAGTGKVIYFDQSSYGKSLNLSVIVDAGHSGTGLIQVHLWNQQPTFTLDGRIWYEDLPSIGGDLIVIPNSAQQAMSFYQVNPDQNNFWDCCCARLDNLNLLITIKSF